MSQIVLTEEQARVVGVATGSVEVSDPQGRLVAFLEPLDPREAEAIRRHRQRRTSATLEPTIPSAHIQAMLRKLEEMDQREEITEEGVKDVLLRLRAGKEL